jgi:hypothetical protein
MSRYRLSFSTGGLLASEIAVACEQILEADSVEHARRELETKRAFAGRTTRAIQRLTQEVVDRAAELTADERRLMRAGSTEDRQNLAWLAATRRYEILAAFARDVMHDKFMSLDLALTTDDFDRFWIAQSQWHPEVEKTAASTRLKLRQNLYKMLREAEYVTADNIIRATYLSPAFLAAVRPIALRDLEIFPIHTATAQELIDR